MTSRASSQDCMDLVSAVTLTKNSGKSSENGKVWDPSKLYS
jgi:hypothetical protein